MTELESFFTDRLQKEGCDANDCIKNILAEGEYNDAYYKYEVKIPVPDCSPKPYYLAHCNPRIREAYEKNGRPFIVFRIAFKMLSDMVDNFQSNVDYSIWINGREYANLPRVLHLCLAFHSVDILLYLDQPNLPDVLTFSFHKHYFSTELRLAIIKSMNPNSILDGDVAYLYGMMSLSSEEQSMPSILRNTT